MQTSRNRKESPDDEKEALSVLKSDPALKHFGPEDHEVTRQFRNPRLNAHTFRSRENDLESIGPLEIAVG